MPIYEYRCGDCGHELDALQKLADEPLRDCPECAQPSLKRLMSAPAFRLKGGGWYETDFKSDKEKKRNLADGGGEAKAGGDAKAGDSKAGDSKGGDSKSGGDKSSADSGGDKKTEKKEQTKAKDSGSTNVAAA